MKKGLLLITLFSAGCGIKANPEVLKEPEVWIRRIGDRVYVKSLSGEVRVREFERRGSYWVKENREAFCFSVERVGGKSRKFCVEGRLEERPSLSVKEDKDGIELRAFGFDSYRIYPVKEENIDLEEAKDFRDRVHIERDYWERCFAITGVKGPLESDPVKLCVKPKLPPLVKDVEDLEVRVGEGKLYLVWFYRDEYREFVVYEKGKEVGRTVGYSFELPLPKDRTTFTVKVINPLGFESKGVSIDYSP